MSTMKISPKTVLSFMIIGIVALTMVISPTAGYAQTDDPTPDPEEAVTETIVLPAEDEYSFTTLAACRRSPSC